MGVRTDVFKKTKESAKKCGVTGLELRASIDAIIQLTKNQPRAIDVENATKSIKEFMRNYIIIRYD